MLTFKAILLLTTAAVTVVNVRVAGNPTSDPCSACAGVDVSFGQAGKPFDHYGAWIPTTTTYKCFTEASYNEFMSANPNFQAAERNGAPERCLGAGERTSGPANAPCYQSDATTSCDPPTPPPTTNPSPGPTTNPTPAVTVVNVQGQPIAPATEYSFGASGADECPSGEAKVTAQNECILAANALGLAHSSGMNEFYSSDQDPGGCFKFSWGGNSYSYFNNHTGTGRADRYIVCSKPSQPTCKPFEEYSNDKFQVDSKRTAKALIATIKSKFKAIKANYLAARKNLRRLKQGPVAPATPGPVAPATPGPVAPATPGPVAPATPGPVAPATPGPVAPATPGPVAPATPGPVAPPATTGAPTCRNGADTNIAPNGTMVACDHPDDGVCEEDFETLCPTGWGLCTHAQWVERRQGWTVNGQLLGEIHCRSGAGAGHFKPVSNQLDGERNCAFGSSRPSCSATYGCNEKAMLALCCAPTPTCGNGAIDSPEELCDDGNQDESDACLNSCDFRAC